MKMAIEDPTLAAVWPDLPAGVSRTRVRRYLYANLIMNEVATGLKISNIDDERVRGVLRVLFGSELLREYWEAARDNRQRLLLPDTTWARFVSLAEEVYSEARHGSS